MNRERDWLGRLRRLCRLLVSETDLDTLFSCILDAAIEITQALRGFLVLVPKQACGPRLRFMVEEARGFQQVELAGKVGAVSRTVVKRVIEQKRGLVTSHERVADHV